MFGRLTSILQHAAEVTSQVLAPQVPRADEFLSHVKAITQQFVDQLGSKSTNEDVPAVETSIPSHLDHMLHLVCEEDEEADEGMGSCMELFLDRKVMGNLQNMAEVDIPSGVRGYVLSFCSELIGQVRQPILAQVSVHEPLQRLVSFFGNSPKVALTELQLLKTLVQKFQFDPLNAEFFLVRKGEGQSFVVMEALVKLAHSKESLICIKSLEAIDMCCQLQDHSIAQSIACHSQLLGYMANRLQLHYKIIPPSVSPNAVLQCQAQWGLDYPVHLFDSKSPPESHYLPGMLAWLDYCSGIASRAHPVLTEHLSTAILEQFLVLCVQTDLVESTEDCQLKALLVLAKGVHYLSSRQLQNTFATFLLGEPGSADSHTVYRALLSALDHLSEDICYAALHLFDALLGLANENIVLRLLEVGHVTSSEALQWKKCVWVEERGKVETLVNQYLSVAPKWLMTSHQVHGSYCFEQYLEEAHTMLARYSSLLALWCSEAVAEKLVWHKGGVAESCFVKAVLGKVERLLDQPYEINLILTSVALKLIATLPPVLEPALLQPVVEGSGAGQQTAAEGGGAGQQTVHSVLLKVAQELQGHCESSITLKLNVVEARRRLEGKETSDLLSMPHNPVVEGAVLFEEFCKELACVLFAKRTLTLLECAQ